MRPDDNTRIGTEIAGYRIEAMLGRGGMSVVYLAEHVRLGRKVALKLLAPMLSSDETYRDRFQRESQRAAELDHPNVVPIFDAGEADGQLFIAMRYVEGCDLKALIRREGQLGIGRTLFILEQAADGLDAAHQHNLIHRDVKPANILIAEPSEHVYLTDFGVVKHTASKGLTRTGFFIGTSRLRGPGADRGPAGRRAHRRLCAGLRALRVPGRQGAVRSRRRDHRHARAPDRCATRADRRAARSAQGSQSRAGERAREGQGRPLRELREADRGRARRRAPAHDHDRRTWRLPRARCRRARPPSRKRQASRRPRRCLPRRPWSRAPVTGYTDTGEPAQPSQATVVPQAAAPQTPPPPAAAGVGRRGAAAGWAGIRRTWLGVGAAILAAALVAAVAVFALTRDSHSTAGSTTNGTTGTTGTATTTTTTPAAAAPGLAGVVLKDVWDKCQVSATPQEGAVQSAVCRRPANATAFFPDRVDLYIYANGAAQKKAFEAFRASDPKSAALVAGQGGCSNVSWNGYGRWRHTDGKPGGQRFCYTDGANDAIIVWTHDRLGTPSHLDFVGVARLRGRGTESSLFSWWNFWHSRLGKCALPGCEAHLPDPRHHADEGEREVKEVLRVASPRLAQRSRVRALIELTVDVARRRDQREVGEGLREVAERLAAGPICSA